MYGYELWLKIKDWTVFWGIVFTPTRQGINNDILNYWFVSTSRSMIGCDTLPIYISAARPAKHEEEILRGQTVSI